jgi:hypothetical protein
MNPRRVIGVSLALALFAGQTFVPVARAACAVPRAKAPAACPSCVGERPTAATSMKADRACCAAPQSVADREPATLAPDRTGEPRVLSAVLPLPSARLLVAWDGDASTGHSRAGPPGSPPHLRTTILLI